MFVVTVYLSEKSFVVNECLLVYGTQERSSVIFFRCFFWRSIVLASEWTVSSLCLQQSCLGFAIS